MNGNDTYQFASAIEAALEADVVMLFLGLDQTQEREMLDRTMLSLPGLQQNLTELIHATGKPIVVVCVCVVISIYLLHISIDEIIKREKSL